MLQVEVAVVAFICSIHDQERQLSFTVVGRGVWHVYIPAECSYLCDLAEFGRNVLEDVFPQQHIHHNINHLPDSTQIQPQENQRVSPICVRKGVRNKTRTGLTKRIKKALG